MNIKKISLSLLLATSIFQVSEAQSSIVLKNSKDSVSYSFGVGFGDYLKGVLKQQGVEADNDLLLQGLTQVIKGQGTALDAQKANSYIQAYVQNQRMIKADFNKKTGEKFLAENKTRAGVVTLPSGLQYQIIKAGTGPKPASTDKVKVHYTGSLIDGTVFDSSVQRGEPATFGVTQVIPGWVEALQLMPVGSKWKLFIPENLAYGAQGPGAIGPNSALLFDVELLEIVKDASAAPAPAATQAAEPKAHTATPATKPAATKTATKKQ